MFKKKKSLPHKQNTQAQINKPKKHQLNTLRNTDDIRIKTLPCIDLKLTKNNDIQKQYSNSKKNISRKTTSRTMKLESSLRNGCLHTLLKQVKDLKKMQVHEFKSKSPTNRKRSKSGTKIKLDQKSPCSKELKHKSQRRLSLKIGDTLKRLEFIEMMHGDDENIVYPSASTRQPAANNNLSTVSQLDGVIIEEIQQYSSKVMSPSRLKVEIKSGDSLQQTIAAITIQRAWRRYRTQKLVERYTNLNFYFYDSDDLQKSDKLNNQLQEQGEESMVVVPSEDFYGQSVEDVQNISHLQQNDALQQFVSTIKTKQLQKWNSILSMIQATKGGGQEQKEKLFLFIQKQSQKNREELINLSHTRGKEAKDDHKQKIRKEQHQQKGNKQQKGLILPQSFPQPVPLPPSESFTSSIGQFKEQNQRVKNATQSESDTNNYNSKKYIEYLDSDVYPDHSSSSSAQGIKNAFGVITISAKRQEMLLQALYSRPAKLPHHAHNTSLSLGQIDEKAFEVPHAARQQSKLRKSASQKIMKRTLSNLSQKTQSDINLQILEQQYLQMYPILKDDNDESQIDNQSPNICPQIQPEQTILKPPSLEDPLQTKLLRNELEDLLQDFTHIQRQRKGQGQGQSQRQQNQEQFGAISEQRQTLSQKADIIAEIVVSELSMEFMRESLRYPRFSNNIKKYFQLYKPKVKKSDNLKKKRGFQTDKKQIQLFLHNLITFILREEYSALDNLHISTGPTAIQMLRYMHSADDSSMSESNSQSQQANIMVIPNKIFDSFWKIKQKSIVVEVPSSFNQEHSIMFRQNIQYLKSFNKIFYRSLFDTFNQCLDLERNYGLLGKPFPWKKSPIFPHQLSEEQKKKCLEKARTKMLTLSTTYCGLMVDTSEIGQSAENEEYLQQVQQDRLSRMLASDLLQSEVRWYFYDDEQAQILIEVSNVIYRELLFELLEKLVDFQ